MAKKEKKPKVKAGPKAKPEPKKPEPKPEKAPVVKMPKENVMPLAEAKRLRDGIIQDFKTAGASLVSAAIKLDAIVRGQGWKALGYATMTEWRTAELNFSEFFRLRNTMKLLEVGVPPAQVEKMKLTNIDTLVRQLPERDWKDTKWIAAAAEMPVSEFESRAKAEAIDVGTIQEEIERRGFAGPKSLIEQWDMALRVAEAVDGAAGLEARVEAIVACYLNSDSQAPGKTKLQRYHEIAQSTAVSAEL
jgi:hypothetical protein